MSINIDLKGKKVGLDVDGVVCNYSQGIIERASSMGLAEYFPKCCHDVDSWAMSEKFQEVAADTWTNPKFWLSLKPLEGAMPLPFEPSCYITRRVVPSQVTAQWLSQWYFPKGKVITVEKTQDKLWHAVLEGLDLFVDDLPSTVRYLRENGVNAILFEQPHQRGNLEECVGLPTIKNLEEIAKYV